VGSLTSFYFHSMHAWLTLGGGATFMAAFRNSQEKYDSITLNIVTNICPHGGFHPCSVRERPACFTRGGNPGQKSVSTTSLQHRYEKGAVKFYSLGRPSNLVRTCVRF
jgi:hypothetical protein